MNFIKAISRQQFLYCIHDLIESPVVRTMDNYIQHSEVSCLEHCLFVAYISFVVCKILRLNYYAAARGALLHDLFLYDWHSSDRRGKLHGLTHPFTALDNANKYFRLSILEQDIIKKHMWPLTFFMPSFAESMVVSMADKLSALIEIMGLYKLFIVRRVMKMCRTAA